MFLECKVLPERSDCHCRTGGYRCYRTMPQRTLVEIEWLTARWNRRNTLSNAEKAELLMLLDSAFERLSPVESDIRAAARKLRRAWLPRPGYRVEDLDELIGNLMKLLSEIKKDHNKYKSSDAKAAQIDIDQLNAKMGPVIAHQLVTSFMSEMPQEFQRMENAIESRNLDQLLEMAGKLKTVSEMLGTNEMRIHSIWLEQAAFEKNWVEARRHVKKCIDSFSNLKEYLLSIESS